MLTFVILSSINEAMIKFYQKLGLITTFVKTEGMYSDQKLFSGYAFTIFIIYLVLAVIFMIIIPINKADKLKKEQNNQGV